MKQRALLTKYPDPAQFILDYNPDLQFKIVRCNATHADLALNLEIPSLGLLASTYGDETPLEWLKIQFGTLNDFAEVSANQLVVWLDRINRTLVHAGDNIRTQISFAKQDLALQRKGY